MKKSFTKILSVLLTLISFMSIVPFNASAVTSGSCGDSVTWSYNTTTKTLTISGNGVMNNYNYSNYPWADYQYSIKKVIVESNVTSIGSYAFYNCSSLSDVTIANTVESIGPYAFQDCKNLEFFYIPENIISIGWYAFNGCDKLIKFTADSNNQFYSTDERGVLFNKDKTTLIKYPSSNVTTDYSVPDSVKTIKQDSFGECENLTSITLSENIVSIEYYAFDECPNLKRVNISDISSWCNIDFGIMYSNPMSHGADLYLNNQKVTELVFPENVKEIKQFAFYRCRSITKVILPDSITKINASTFEGCINLKSITIPDTVTSIRKYAFNGCRSLESIELPDSIKSIGMYSFMGCTNLKSVTLPDNLTDLFYYSFDNCENLESVTIPVSLKTIQKNTFYNCTSLTDVYYSGTKEQWENMEIENGNTPLFNATIHFNSCFSNNDYQHNHKSVVTAPTCTEQGYTTYTCECGDTYVDDYVDATGHSHTAEITTPATHLSVGVKTFTCSCGDTYTEVIDKIATHNHIATETAPTCTEKGFTTYTCECGDSYVADYVDELGHSHTATVTAPTCTEQGFTTYTCECGDTYVADYVDATGHSEGDNEGNCSACGEHICDHDCHKSGIAGFFWKIICFFSKLFGSNKFCECGKAHY